MPGEKTWAQVWAEREQLRIENERLRAELEKTMGDRYVQKMTPDMREQADAFNAKLGQTGEMLGAESPEHPVAVAESGSTLGETRAQLAELREAAERVREAMKRDSYTTDDKGKRVPDAFRHFPEVIALDAVLAKVKA
jgi:hypothetical protein